MAISLLLNYIYLAILLHLCNYIFVTSEYGQKNHFLSTTEGNVTKILTAFKRSNLDCACHCLKFGQCDSSVFCSGFCSLYKSQSNKIGSDLISGDGPCIYTIFPARMVCGIHGERSGNSCICDDGWIGAFCTFEDNLWTQRYKTEEEDYEMKSVLNQTLQEGARVSILENISDRKILYYPLMVTTGDHIYAQTVYETSKDGETFMTSPVTTNKILQLDELQIVNHVSKSITNRKASLTWFTKGFTTNQPCLSLSNGLTVLGSVIECFSAVFNGAEIFAVIDNQGSSVLAYLDEINKDISYSLPMQIKMKSNETGLLPDSPLQWEFVFGSLFSNELLKSHFHMNGEGIHQNQFIFASRMTFFVDNFWHKTYSYVNGEVAYGTFANLKNAILSGKRVRLKFGNWGAQTTVVNAEHIYLTNEAGIYYTPQPSFLEDLGEATISELRTDGKFIHCTVSMESLEVIFYNELHNVNMSWYVEDRPWNRILHVGANGETLDGSTINLKNLTLIGKRIRVIIVISEDMHRAMDVNQVEMTDENDMIFSAGPFTSSTNQTCFLVSYLIGGGLSLSRIQSRTWSLVSFSYTTSSFNAETIWFVDEPFNAN